MQSPDLFDSMELALKSARVNELLEVNRELRGQGLALSQADALDILSARTRSLRNRGRIELDIRVTKELVKRLAESPYILAENYVGTVNDLYEVFHFIKNATSDFTGDDEILDAVLFSYNNLCGGSTELLMGKGAAKIIENFEQKRELTDNPADEEEEEYWNFDE